MTSLCGHVKALIGEWVIEKMGEKHHNEERERTCVSGLTSVCGALFLSGICFHFLIECQLNMPIFSGFSVYLKGEKKMNEMSGVKSES